MKFMNDRFLIKVNFGWFQLYLGSGTIEQGVTYDAAEGARR